MTLPANLLAESQVEHGESPWITLYRLTISVTSIATTVVQLCDQRETITWDGTTWDGYSVHRGSIRLDSQGGLPSFEIVLSNATRVFTPYLVATDASFMGQLAEVFIVHRDWLADTTQSIRFEAAIQMASADKDNITLRIEPPNPFAREIPSSIYNGNGCEAIYRGSRCRARGDIATCEHTHDACTAIGNREVEIGYPRLHPQMFGGFPAAPRQS